MRSINLGLAAALAFATALAVPANAQEAALALPEGCQLVALFVPDVNVALPNVPLTFRGEGSGVAAISWCNPEGKTSVIGVNPSATAGSRVILATESGRATIGLPTVYTSGDVHNVGCVVIEDGALDFRLYQLAWRDGLPAELDLIDASDEIVGDRATHIAGCMAKATPDILALLKK